MKENVYPIEITHECQIYNILVIIIKKKVVVNYQNVSNILRLK